MKKFWENNLNCKEIKSETITYQTKNDISVEKISVKFDYVIRNKEEEIIAVGRYIEQEDETGLNKYYGQIKYDFPYPTFFLDEAGCLFFMDNNKSNFELPGSLFNYDLPPIHFIELLKKMDRSLMLDSDIRIEELEIQNKNTTIELDECVKNKTELLQKIEIENKYFEKRSTEYYQAIRNWEKQERDRILFYVKNSTDFQTTLDKVTNVSQPNRVISEQSKRYGDYIYKYDSSVTESEVQYFICYWEGKWVLKLEVYDWYERGPSDVPQNVLSYCKYFEYSESVNNFVETDNPKIKDLLLWLSIAEAKIELGKHK